MVGLPRPTRSLGEGRTAADMNEANNAPAPRRAFYSSSDPMESTQSAAGGSQGPSAAQNRERSEDLSDDEDRPDRKRGKREPEWYKYVQFVGSASDKNAKFHCKCSDDCCYAPSTGDTMCHGRLDWVAHILGKDKFAGTSKSIHSKFHPRASAQARTLALELFEHHYKPSSLRKPHVRSRLSVSPSLLCIVGSRFLCVLPWDMIVHTFAERPF